MLPPWIKYDSMASINTKYGMATFMTCPPMCRIEQLAMRITKWESGVLPHGNDKHYLTTGMCDIYIIMMAVPRYFTLDGRCPSFSMKIHNGQ